MLSPVTIVQIIEIPAEALPPNSRPSYGETAIGAHAEATSVYCSCLRGLIELELIV